MNLSQKNQFLLKLKALGWLTLHQENQLKRKWLKILVNRRRLKEPLAQWAPMATFSILLEPKPNNGCFLVKKHSLKQNLMHRKNFYPSFKMKIFFRDTPV